MWLLVLMNWISVYFQRLFSVTTITTNGAWVWSYFLMDWFNVCFQISFTGITLITSFALVRLLIIRIWVNRHFQKKDNSNWVLGISNFFYNKLLLALVFLVNWLQMLFVSKLILIFLDCMVVCNKLKRLVTKWSNVDKASRLWRVMEISKQFAEL